ncbi:MAG: hypothetical protein OD918_11585 [Gammaproteobacteria bacterium]
MAYAKAKFKVYGPFPLKTSDDGSRLLHQEANVVKKDFVEQTVQHTDKSGDPLSGACGCYVFVIRASGTLPWYVGKTERSNFGNQCMYSGKLRQFESALRGRERGVPELYLLPQMTDGDKFVTSSKVNKPAINSLEGLLITLGVWRNKDLLNSSNAQKWRDLEVDGFYNSKKRGRRSEEVAQLRDVFDLEDTLHDVFGL